MRRLPENIGGILSWKSRILSCRLRGGRAVSLLQVGQVVGWQEGAATVSLRNKEEE